MIKFSSHYNKVHCTETTFDMKKNQIKCRALKRGKITNFSLIILFCSDHSSHWQIVFWMNIFVKTMTDWLNIWELHRALVDFCSKWLHVHLWWSRFDTLKNCNVVFVPQKNTKLALAVWWLRQVVNCFIYFIWPCRIWMCKLRECSKCSWWKVGQMTRRISLIT